MIDYKVHDVLWTPEKVSRFWDYENNERKNPPWFTMQVGDGVWNFAKKYIPRNARILDYGAGQGFLSEHILKSTQRSKVQNITVDCSEFSPAGLKKIEQRLSPYPNFGKTVAISTFPLPVPDHSYDALFFIEAIEHLSEEYFLPTLKEFKRLLKSRGGGGVIVITVDNDENMDANMVHCPDCGCVFHRIQHLRKFTPESMAELMSRIGFRTLYSGATNFWQHKDNIPLKRKIFLKLFHKLIYRNKPPHLVYIGENI